MTERIAIIGAGVSGLTCGVVLAEHGYPTSIFAKHTGQQTTSGAAAAVWFPYHVEPAERVIPLALKTYDVLLDLARFAETGVSVIESKQFLRTGEIEIPDWAIPLGASVIPSAVEAATEQTKSPGAGFQSRDVTLKVSLRDPSTPRAFAGSAQDDHQFASGFSLRTPLTDTTIYLDYLAVRFRKAGGEIHADVCFEKIDEVDEKFDFVINCAGIGARELLQDTDLEPHRGQVAIVSKIEGLSSAIVCDDEPLMYAIPRKNDCVFGGTNELSDNLSADSVTTSRIVAECSRVLNIEKPRVIAERVGLRPFRRSGVRLERDQSADGRRVIHNYGHGGAGFTLSWGCAREVLDIALSS
ncbi:MAG TPA: FAD-dependent oxidoreductase [Candidatus Udaeobacter sp.]|nr:FAD-dependent oxidoreductase [Candidatus Udaeobacter sp.]